MKTRVVLVALVVATMLAVPNVSAGPEEEQSAGEEAIDLALACLQGDPSSPCYTAHECKDDFLAAYETGEGSGVCAVAGGNVGNTQRQAEDEAERCTDGETNGCEEIAACLAGEPFFPCNPDPHLENVLIPTECQYLCETVNQVREMVIVDSNTPVPDLYLLQCSYYIAVLDVHVPAVAVNTQDICPPGSTKTGSQPLIVDEYAPETDFVEPVFRLSYGECDYQATLVVYGLPMGPLTPMRAPCAFLE